MQQQKGLAVSLLAALLAVVLVPPCSARRLQAAFGEMTLGGAAASPAPQAAKEVGPAVGGAVPEVLASPRSPKPTCLLAHLAAFGRHHRHRRGAPPAQVADAVHGAFGWCNTLPANQSCDFIANTTVQVGGRGGQQLQRHTALQCVQRGKACGPELLAPPRSAAPRIAASFADAHPAWPRPACVRPLAPQAIANATGRAVASVAIVSRCTTPGCSVVGSGTSVAQSPETLGQTYAKVRLA